MLKDMGKFEPTETTLRDVRKTVKDIFMNDKEGDGYTLNELRKILGG